MNVLVASISCKLLDQIKNLKEVVWKAPSSLFLQGQRFWIYLNVVPVILRTPGNQSQVLTDIQAPAAPASVVVLPMFSYDVILGMDWLTRHSAIIDCALKQVTRTPW
jgi:hypothetical protein